MKPKESESDAELRSIGQDLLYLGVCLKLIYFCRLAIKAGFDPDQPRNPKRSSGAGRWRRTQDPVTPEKSPRFTRGPRMPAKTGRLRPPAGIGHNGPPKTSVPEVRLEDVPKIPPEKPPVSSQRTKIAKRIAAWVLTATMRRALGPVGLLFDLIKLIEWIQEYKPSIQSYFDEPLTLEELQSYAGEPKDGYEIHHIVERMSAARDGFSRLDIDGYDNIVRVPTYKHHEITNWYDKANPDFGDLSPRKYLEGKPWEDRVIVGKYALRLHGVLR